MHNFQNFKDKIKEVEFFLSKEFNNIRTGRAVTTLLDCVSVEVYGSKMSIKELASVSLEDARTIKIEPYDHSVIKDIEKAIISANLGLSISTYEKGLRAIFPELTAERRDEFAKLARKKLEESKISLRNLRDKEWTLIQDEEKIGKISEDVKFKSKEEMQRFVDEGNKILELMTQKKEEEIRR